MKLLEKNPIIMIIIGILGISLSAIFVRLSDAPSPVTAAYRLLWTVLLLTPITLGSQKNRTEITHIDGKNFWLSCISGIFLAIHFTLWFESLYHTTVASSTTIVCTEMIWVSIGYCLFMHGKLSKKAVFLILFIFFGSVLIAMSDSTGESNLYGDILSLLSAIAVAVYMLIGRKVRMSVSTTVYTYIVYFSCAITLVIFTVMLHYSLTGYGISCVIVGLLLSVFSTLLGHSIFSWCLKYFSPSFVSASKLCEPVVASIIAIFLFGEMPGPMQIIGSIIIISGVYLYSKLETQD